MAPTQGSGVGPGIGGGGGGGRESGGRKRGYAFMLLLFCAALSLIALRRSTGNMAMELDAGTWPDAPTRKEGKAMELDAGTCPGCLHEEGGERVMHRDVCLSVDRAVATHSVCVIQALQETSPMAGQYPCGLTHSLCCCSSRGGGSGSEQGVRGTGGRSGRCEAERVAAAAREDRTSTCEVRTSTCRPGGAGGGEAEEARGGTARGEEQGVGRWGVEK